MIAPLLAIALLASATAKSAQAPTVRDSLGRDRAALAPSDRIVSTSPAGTEILFAIGAGAQVVGRSRYDEYPPEALAVESVGGFTPDSVSLEKIVALRPALVVTGGSLQRPLVASLERVGLTAFHFEAEDIDSIYDAIERIGRVSGHGAEVRPLVASMRADVARIRARVAEIPLASRPRVFYEVWDEPLMTAGPKSLVGELLDLAGGVNVFADVAGDYPQVSSEAVVVRDPDVIVVPSSHGTAVTAETVLRRSGWQRISAVRSRRVFVVAGDEISRPGPRIAQALEALARALHPARFATPVP